MNYTLNQLQIFLKITQTKSITKAAEELFLTQPAVSIQLKNFQDQFDIPLTEIVGRKLFVTDFGKEIAWAAENIINQVNAINYKTLSYKGQLTGRLRISSVSTGKYVIPYFLTDFLKQHPGIELKLDVSNKTQVVESLEQNEVDFSLVSVLPDQLQIEKEKLMLNKLYVVGNRNHTYAERNYDKSIFETMSLIYREQGSGTRHTMEKYMAQFGLKVKKKMELASNEVVKQAVIAGMGISIMPLIGIINELITGDLQIIKVEGFPIESNWNLIWMKSKNHSPIASAYLAYIRENKENIIAQKFQRFGLY